MTGCAESLKFGFEFKPMPLVRNFLPLLILFVMLVGCKGKKKPSLAGEDPVKVSDFIEFFPRHVLPFQFDDAELRKKSNDSLLISYKVFTQFVPDSLLSKVFGKGVKPKIYPIGRATEPKKESYLFVKTVVGQKRAAFLICFDKNENFIAGMPVLRPDQSSLTLQTAGLDKKFSISKTIQRKNADGSVNEGKDVYILDAASKNFILILTDPLDEKPAELINPIDTLPRKNKLSGDYIINKTNLVSIRDGRKPGLFMFFVHIDKNKGECTGELKGEAVMKSATVAEYHANGNLCALRFTFTSNSVSLKEIEACGTYRGLHCLFDGTFKRKKETKPKKPAK